jgi:hypothetical protein
MNDHANQGPAEAERANRTRTRRAPSNRKRAGWIVAAALTSAALGLAGCTATSAASAPASSTPSSSASAHSAHAPGAAGGASNARSGPAAGGSVGTVSAVTSASFTLTTVTGQKVTIKEASSTSYDNGTTSASASVVTTGESVLVLGTTDSTTITATQVTVEPAGGATSATASDVVPFTQGSPSTSKKVGTIPTNYTEGSGTIVSGTTANKATEAALAAYPGGVVDRVVKLSNGEYEVHFIGVNWPHHVFVNSSFTVVGAD